MSDSRVTSVCVLEWTPELPSLRVYAPRGANRNKCYWLSVGLRWGRIWLRDFFRLCMAARNFGDNFRRSRTAHRAIPVVNPALRQRKATATSATLRIELVQRGALLLWIKF